PRGRWESARSACRRRRARSPGCRDSAPVRRRPRAAPRPTARRSTARARQGSRAHARRCRRSAARSTARGPPSRDDPTMAVADGIHRIEQDLGDRYVAQYLVDGKLLVDTGLRDMPRAIDAAPDTIFISHADVDHCGGNLTARTLWPQARFLCGEADRGWIESNAAMLAGNYRWYEAYGFGPAVEDIPLLEHELRGHPPGDTRLPG